MKARWLLIVGLFLSIGSFSAEAGITRTRTCSGYYVFGYSILTPDRSRVLQVVRNVRLSTSNTPEIKVNGTVRATNPGLLCASRKIRDQAKAEAASKIILCLQEITRSNGRPSLCKNNTRCSLPPYQVSCTSTAGRKRGPSHCRTVKTFTAIERFRLGNNPKSTLVRDICLHALQTRRNNRVRLRLDKVMLHANCSGSGQDRRKFVYRGTPLHREVSQYICNRTR